jgi:hypothetical protein
MLDRGPVGGTLVRRPVVQARPIGQGIEIHFMPVGDGENASWGATSSIMSSMAATSQPGETLVKHIRTRYGNTGYIDYVLCTHVVTTTRGRGTSLRISRLKLSS